MNEPREPASGLSEPGSRREAGVDREAAARAIEAFLRALGRDPAKEPELAGTGDRVARAWADELLAGYAVDVDAVLAESVLPGDSGLVVVRGIPVATTCPHHLMPSTGEATVAFAPAGTLVGVGAVARVVDACARRLALQEQLGEDVVRALEKHLRPRWAACRVVLSHACMTARGERTHGARVETVALRGEGADVAVIHAALGVGR
ncbi:MAG TPA: GTP cyclohydrolase I [Polyangiaceae bacterium]|jgi:GTP cyclohydrolase I|nr:GTP cyclohydrolase I [Polyangiaceae bacterium]